MQKEELDQTQKVYLFQFQSKKIKNKKTQLSLNIIDTKYEVIKLVANDLNFKIISDANDCQWDLFWTDSAVQSEDLVRMKPYQKINHWPGMFSLSRKNNLGIYLMKMRKKFATYNFFPLTWIVPADNSELRSQFNRNQIFIVKPEASCQGKGIFLVRKYSEIPLMESFVVQKYLDKPYLIDGLKFDLRLYVLLAGVDPLRMYMYKEGMARFATVPYECSGQQNLNNMCQHLTNYAINMNNSNYIFNKQASQTDIGHKRSFTSILKHLQKEGCDTEKLVLEIQQMFVKTFASAQPIIAHHFKSCQPDNYKNNMCFEILGMDVILDNKLKPWLLEVNHTPSFSTDTPFDHEIKFNVIKDTIILMNLNENEKISIIQKQKEDFQKRIQGGSKQKMTILEKQALIQQLQLERDEWELNNLGNFECITNVIPQIEIQEYIDQSRQFYVESTGGCKYITNQVVKRNAFKDIISENIKANQSQNNTIQIDNIKSLIEKKQSEEKSQKQMLDYIKKINSPFNKRNNELKSLQKSYMIKPQELILNFQQKNTQKYVTDQKILFKNQENKLNYYLPSLKIKSQKSMIEIQQKSLKLNKLSLVQISLNIDKSQVYRQKQSRNKFLNE